MVCFFSRRKLLRQLRQKSSKPKRRSHKLRPDRQHPLEKTDVTTKQIAVKTNTSGRVALAHSGAIPYRGKYRGTIFKSPAIAEAPANHNIKIVLMS